MDVVDVVDVVDVMDGIPSMTAPVPAGAIHSVHDSSGGQPERSIPSMRIPRSLSAREWRSRLARSQKPWHDPVWTV